jgi:hypothetical protein
MLGACGGGHAETPAPTDDAALPDGNPALVLPASNAHIDYQLGGAYTPPMGVTVVSRDRSASPAAGLYNICYVNGFQIQPEEASWWQTNHPDLILRDASGNPIIDADWNEMLIDVSAPKRAAVASIVGGWIDGCKQSGFDALEIDNLDSYTRSQGRLTADDAVAMMHMFTDLAHARALPAAQKNSAELVARKAELGTDFAVAEECVDFQECTTYTDGYGDHVLVIEYTQSAFDTGCTQFPSLSIVLRDRNLVTPTDTGYVYAGC